MAELIFLYPRAFLLLLLVPAILVLARRRIVPRGGLVLRLAVVAALAVSLAGPNLGGLGGGEYVIFALDLSASISAASRQMAIDFAREAARHRRPGDRIGLVTFGATALLEEAPTADPLLAVTSHPAAEATDIAQAIRTALSALPSSGGRRIVVATDGNANRGDLEQALALARSQGVEVSVLPLQSGSGRDVLVEEVLAPAEVRAGERFLVRVPIVATAEAQVTLQIKEDDRLIAERRIRVAPGRTTTTLSRVAAAEGVLRYTATLLAAPDEVAGNNRAEALVTVRGAPVVWYAGTAPGVLSRVLEAQGMRVRSTAPESLPASLHGYSGIAAVVLDDVSALWLSAAQMASLRDFVGHLGGGLIAVGGPHSFGVGGYAGTPLEDVLPVTMDVRHRLAIPSMAIVLVLDTSGSMGAFGTQIAKVELAKETAQSVVDLLGERDVIGVISFDQEPRWLAPPTEARHREQVMEQVARIQAGGGTNMYPALRLAYDYLRTSAAKVRHVIVISDGQTDPGDFQGLITRMSRDKITTSAVAVGGDADEPLMRSVARWGGGRYYLAKDLYTIPQILTAEALLASRSYLVEERFIPEVVHRGLIDDLALRPLRGYVATSPKPAGTLHLVSPADDPILATWQYGLGRAAAFTADASGRWAAEWIAWPGLARFWSRLVRWAAREDGDGLQVSVEQVDASGQRAPAGGTAAITVDAFTAAGLPVDGLQVEARVAGPEGAVQTLTLVQAAPGRYEGRIPAARAGAYVVSVVARHASGVRRTTTGFVVPYAPELRDLVANRTVLAHLAEATGGRLLSDPRAAVAPTRSPREAADAWPYTAAAAAALFLAEITWRRIPAIGDSLRSAGALLLARLRPPPSSQEAEADRFYEEADRWRLVEPAPTEGAESMEAAARLYIARLKAAQSEDQRKRGAR
ncbi:MAG: VWA domain-containing protein [Armatimonadota bacterium]|nr:VWA domain-containing protein [Armatimonadota bacterium]MDR7451592.1 VWA domain-containing protein [Armatimonadota bacterium]MDR7467688.1 VWA domain-containing protein [Armatimonadota bacterium]MDR7492561.1 VWA domain-containing protein [Armatimonadota bacterium]MDR7500492.1 VWA domain-containing protein [Armatimonadota bacterium]